MLTFPRLLRAESLKWRRAPVIRLVVLLPLLFVAFDFLLLERPGLTLHTLSDSLRSTLEAFQGRLVVSVWGGFIHPLVVALVPALLFRPEHRFKTWRHLGAMPAGRRQLFLAKAVSVLGLTAFMLLFLGLLLWVERGLLGTFNPLLALPFHGRRMALILGWLWLGSLPVTVIYVWVSDRISSAAVPIVFGVAGLLLAITLTGQELDRPWRRDLIPWVLPYAAAERVIHGGPAQQEVHAAGRYFQPEADVIRLPSGRKVKVHANIPEDQLFPPPPPTSAWLLGTFSAAAGLLLLALAWLDAGHERG